MVRFTHARRVGVVNTMNGRTNVTGGGSNGSLGGVIPLEAPSNFTVTPDNGKCLLTWTDPKDKYADEIGEITDEGDQLVSQFAYTRVVRKQGSAPSSPSDGDLVTDSSTRNQYQSSAYVDDGLTNNTLYYYAAFTCNTDGVYSGAAVGSGTPKSYDPILANNTWEQINDVANEGIASSVWNIGDEIDITLGSILDTTTLTIIGFNVMDVSDDSGKAAITFASKTVFPRPDYNSSPTWFSEMGYGNCVINLVYNAIDQSIRSYMPQVKAYEEFNDEYTNGGERWESRTYNSYTFGFPVHEIQGKSFDNRTYDYPTEGYDQWPYFSTQSNRIIYNQNNEREDWMTTTLGSTRVSSQGMSWEQLVSCSVNTRGGITNYANNVTPYVCFGFCIGKTPA